MSLSEAVRCGHGRIVKLLIERNDIDVNPKDKYGETPLQYAAKGGHEEMVKLLMGYKNVDVNSKDNLRCRLLSD
jgi:ankyrin repeat protein